jgi:prepilin-type N-terminal cleavage/methylation domain-containing protein
MIKMLFTNFSKSQYGSFLSGIFTKMEMKYGIIFIDRLFYKDYKDLKIERRNNMHSKKGFTLLELLAVIVILAMIALITVPILLGTIEGSKVGAARDSGYGYIQAIKIALGELKLEPGQGKLTGTYQIKDGNLSRNGTTIDVTVSYKGSKPTGTVTLNEGEIETAKLAIDGVDLIYDGKTVKVDQGDIVQQVYVIGDAVTVKGIPGMFHVLVNSGANESTVKLLYDDNFGSTRFHTVDTDTYEGSLLQQKLNESTATWKTKVTTAGGTTEDMVIDLPTKDEMQAVLDYYGIPNATSVPSLTWLNKDVAFFTKSVMSKGVAYVFTRNRGIATDYMIVDYGDLVRPTMVTSKANVTLVS